MVNSYDLQASLLSNFHQEGIEKIEIPKNYKKSGLRVSKSCECIAKNLSGRNNMSHRGFHKILL